jgi:membrane protein
VVARGRWIRSRYGWLDHLVRAGIRYQQVDGRRLAAAVAYYGFFAAFALGLLAFSVLGFVLDEPAFDRSVQRFLDSHLPQMDTRGLRDSRGAAGLFAMVSLPVIGMLWVDSLRSSVRAIWHVEQYPGRFLTRWLVDLLALVALGMTLLVSLTIGLGAEVLLDRLVVAVGGDDLALTRRLLAAAGFVFGLAVNTLFSVAVLSLLPRLRMPLRRVLPPAVVIVIGVEVLTSSGRLVVARAEANPAFQVVAGTAGLLVFLLILNQLILYAAAIAATGTGGLVRDLATGQQLSPDGDGSPPGRLPAERAPSAQEQAVPEKVGPEGEAPRQPG